MISVSRRGFVGGALAFGTCGAFGAVRHAVGEEPRLRFGVMSDVHIGGKPDAVARAEKVLRWFAAKNVDAVLCPGDIAHSGHIRELEAFADVWHRVFPGNGKRGTGKQGEKERGNRETRRTRQREKGTGNRASGLA